jgi:hypothetical protein
MGGGDTTGKSSVITDTHFFSSDGLGKLGLELTLRGEAAGPGP